MTAPRHETTAAGTPGVGVPAAVLDIENLTVAWDDHIVLDSVSLSVSAGQVVALTGANGSGKSTLVKAILANAPRSSGTVRIFGVDNRVSRRVPWQRIGYVPQRVTENGGISTSVLEVVSSGLLGPRKFWSGREDKKRAMEALRQVGLEERAQDPLAILSGGQKQRALIARALVRNPDLLIMDEPLAGVDSDSKAQVVDIIEAAKNGGTTVLIVLHELAVLGHVLDHEVHLHGGLLTYDGPARIEATTQSQSGATTQFQTDEDEA